MLVEKFLRSLGASLLVDRQRAHRHYPSHRVTFRVTSRWQNPQAVVNGRKNPKNFEGCKRFIFRSVVRNLAVFRGFLEANSRTPTLSDHPGSAKIFRFSCEIARRLFLCATAASVSNQALHFLVVFHEHRLATRASDISARHSTPGYSSRSAAESSTNRPSARTEHPTPPGTIDSLERHWISGIYRPFSVRRPRNRLNAFQAIVIPVFLSLWRAKLASRQ